MSTSSGVALVTALRGNDCEAARRALASATESDILAADESGRTPLHIAAAVNSDAVLPLIETLVTRGASVNAVNAHGFTPLHRAAVEANDNVALLLVRLGGDLTIKNAKGWTPLEMAKSDALRDGMHFECSFRAIGRAGSDF